MPTLPLSPRLALLPVWALLSFREWMAERGRTVLEIRVSVKKPLPSAREIRAVAESDRVRGLWFQVDSLHAGWATLASVRDAIQRVRAAGKVVVFELEHCGNAEMYLASAADRVWLRPMVQVHLLGVGAALRFAGDAFARFGLRFDMEAAGAYKSFGETYTRSFASPENREAMAELVADLQAELEEAVATGRRLDRDVVRKALADAPLLAEDAVARGLIDGTRYPDAVKEELESLFGENVRFAQFPAWVRAHGMRSRLEGWMEGRPRVAVVHLSGPVVDGEGTPGVQSIAARPVSAALDKLAEDEGVVGTVLHIRSPGGSATASDVVWRSVQRLQQKKPVVAVFGDVAASGGYYIAAPAAEILARPNSLTGSIGVVGGKLVVGAALERLGVHSELILGAPRAAYLSPEVPFDEVGRTRFKQGLEHFYRGFVERVAAGRRKPYEAVEPHARGRVWTGRRALELGLVDRLGGVQDGIARAATLAGVRAPRRVDLHLGTPPSRLMRIARSAMEVVAPQLRWLPEIPESARLLAESRGAPLLLLPWDIDVR